MIRVCTALGPWQILMLGAALRAHEAREAPGAGSPRRDVLVLYEMEEASPELRGLMNDLAKAIWPWDRIVWLDGETHPFRPTADAFRLEWCITTRDSFQSALNSIRNRVGLGDADELWACKGWNGPEHALFEAFPGARIVLYEDGLHFFIRQPVRLWHRRFALASPQGLARALKCLVLRDRPRQRPGPLQFSADHVPRFDSIHGLIAARLPVPEPMAHLPVLEIDAETLRRTVVVARSSLGIEPTPGGPSGPIALVLGQSVYRMLGEAFFDRERLVYRSAIDHLIEQGYSVYWKDHPRNARPFFGPGFEEFPPGRVMELPIPSTHPVELAIQRESTIEVVASAFSSGLYYLPAIDPSIRPITFGRLLEAADLGEGPLASDFRTMINLVERSGIPAIADPIPATAAAARP